MARVLVTNGEERAALAVVRSLGRAGHEVVVLSDRERTSLAGWSRWAERRVGVPSALDDPPGFVGAVAEVVRESGVEVVIPITEAALALLSPERGALAPAVLPFPDEDRFRRATDKELVGELALASGLEAPRQWEVGGEGEGALPPGADAFPVVVKPSRSVSRSGGRIRKTPGVRYAGNEGELRRVLREFPADSYPLLIQERIEGAGVGLFFLVWEGVVRARFAHRRLREKPPSGGVSVLRESISVPEEWFEAGGELLRRLDWTGVAMVELKIDDRSGRPYLMEINPRFWGSLQLAIDAGVDFPRLLVDLSTGGGVPPVASYPAGVRTRWFWGDVDHLIARLRRTREELDLPADAPGRWSSILGFLRGFDPRVKSEVLKLSDPLPGLVESVRWLRGE